MNALKKKLSQRRTGKKPDKKEQKKPDKEQLANLDEEKLRQVDELIEQARHDKHFKNLSNKLREKAQKSNTGIFTVSGMFLGHIENRVCGNIKYLLYDKCKKIFRSLIKSHQHLYINLGHY